ncbi:hypothetical protein F4778DRAFT_797798 [Xylariomycetidae sp. FL2044]|nr:hypothetical protein F4778DRAFT_797798 [Xylariomycetidae sp. FL2044]
MAQNDDFELVSQGQQTPDETPTPKKEMNCEVKEYEARYDHEGKRAVKEVSRKQDADLKDDGKFAMRLYKYYNRESRIEKVNLEIQSPHIQEALRTIVRSYPDQNFTGSVTLTGNSEWLAMACLFHYKKELRLYGEGLEDTTAKRHVCLTVDLVEREFSRDIRRFESNIASSTPSIEFRDLWMLFRPGDLTFSSGNNSYSQCINKIVKVMYNAGGMGCVPSWIIIGKAFIHNGSTFGYTHRQLAISAYDGHKDVQSLPVSPLQFQSENDSIQKLLIARGQKYCSLHGIQYRAYSGVAIAVDKERTVSYTGRASNSFPQEPIDLDGRIMLDCKSFIEERTDSDIKMHEPLTLASKDLSEEEYMLCHFAIAGYSLSEKQWCWFAVDFVRDIDFDEDAFEALMLPSKQKRLIRALTAKHTSSRDTFDDLIHGKGKGCIFLLHGEPGIGKTFTAESIADNIKRPLYVMMSGELGSDVKTVDKNLRKVLKLVTTWKAVLLIDEADVFLEKRSSRDLARNSLVSVFLRTLEYFSGVMFLTTNRVKSFDMAFQSRIHLALKYNPLDTPARAALWKLFLQRTADFDAREWPPEHLEELAAADINGRQIKNTVRTAYALALSEDEKLGMDQVRDVLETVGEFRAEFTESQATTQSDEGYEAAAVAAANFQDFEF